MSISDEQAVKAKYPHANVAQHEGDDEWEVWRGVGIDSPYQTDEVLGHGASVAAAWLSAAWLFTS